jgi:uncharacterized protein (DUF2062 family)
MKFLLKYKPIVKLATKTKDLLISGMTPHQLSLALTMGIIFGVIPFPGTNTIILTVIALSFNLNMVIVQLTNYVVYPLQLILYLPFIRLGKYIGNRPSISPHQVMDIMKANWLSGIEKLWDIQLWAIISWALVSIPVSYLLYRLLRDWIEKIKNRLIFKYSAP